MRYRIALLAAGLGATAFMAGCDPTLTAAPETSTAPFAPVATQTGAAAPAAKPVATTASTAAKPVATTAPTTAKPRAATEPTAAKPAGTPTTGCPVTGDTLLSVLRDDTGGMYERAGTPAALVEPACFEGYAVARTASDGRHDRVSIVFTYDVAATAWRPINLGSADFCTGVPAVVAPHLPGCQ